ncbi:MAG: hypothetical protein U0X87_04810 [Anaerolineales bacterium]
MAMEIDYPVTVEPLKDQLKPAALEQESVSSFLVVPGLGRANALPTRWGISPNN